MAQNAPIQLNLPDPSGTAWTLFAVVMAFLISRWMSLRNSDPAGHPEIIRADEGWVRAVGAAVRPFRRRENPAQSPRPSTAVPPLPAAW